MMRKQRWKVGGRGIQVEVDAEGRYGEEGMKKETSGCGVGIRDPEGGKEQGASARGRLEVKEEAGTTGRLREQRQVKIGP